MIKIIVFRSIEPSDVGSLMKRLKKRIKKGTQVFFHVVHDLIPRRGPLLACPALMGVESNKKTVALLIYMLYSPPGQKTLAKQCANVYIHPCHNPWKEIDTKQQKKTNPF
jgi:hypothetical protein